MDYSKLSDDEIDQLVTANEYNLKEWEFNEAGGFFYHCGPDGSGYFEQPVIKFCSDWSIAGFLIVEHSISLNSIHNYQSGICEPTGRWLAEVYSGGFSAIDKNPLRCAMIVFLMSRGLNESE